MPIILISCSYIDNSIILAIKITEALLSNIDPLIANKQRILFAVLNWGLGHATRSVPLINYILAQGKEVVLASDGQALFFLKNRFPLLKTIELPSYNINYNSTSVILNSIFQGPKILKARKEEHIQTKKIIKAEHIDFIISDSRFGVYNDEIPSFIIAHQLNLKTGNRLIQPFAAMVNRYFLNKFDQILVPDYNDQRLSGELSNGFTDKKIFIGALSRFLPIGLNSSSPKYIFAAILSGPEPSRTNLEKIVIPFLQNQGNSILVRGLVGNVEDKLEVENVEIINFAYEDKLLEIINTSERIICRSGYSSIMDLCVLNKKAILIPTPYQAEQEYLAVYHRDLNNGFEVKSESEL
jgi:uncharacterized protein (TIGR00661 family)